MRRFLGKSWLWWLNFCVLQWFFVRLARSQNVETGAHEGWVLFRWPIPLTGWGSVGYTFVGGESRQTWLNRAIPKPVKPGSRVAWTGIAIGVDASDGPVIR
jgi:hypothetical protein